MMEWNAGLHENQPIHNRFGTSTLLPNESKFMECFSCQKSANLSHLHQICFLKKKVMDCTEASRWYVASQLDWLHLNNGHIIIFVKMACLRASKLLCLSA